LPAQVEMSWDSDAGRRNVARVWIVVITVVMIFVLSMAVGNRTPATQYLSLEKKGVRARGLVLACDRVSLGGVRVGARRFEKWTMTLDIEIPGRAPYVSTGDFLVPRGMVETVPGAALDLAVHPSKQNLVAVLGPGGFTGPWLRVGPSATY
jgi:hypothetical protein